MRKPKSIHIRYLKKLYPYIFTNKTQVFSLFAIKFAIMIANFFPPLMYQYYINQVVSEGELKKLIYVILVYLLLFVFQTLMIVLSKLIETKYTNKIKVDLKNRLLNIYSSIPYSEYEQEEVAEIRLRVESDTETICSFYINHCLNYFFSFIYSISIIAILSFMNSFLVLFGLLMIVLSFLITKFLGEKIKKASQRYRKEQSDFDATIYEAFQHWKEIKLNNLEQQEVDLLSEKWHHLSKSLLRSTRFKFLHGALIAFNLFFTTRMNLYFFGGLLIIKKLMTVPTMLVFMNYYEQLYSNIQTILNSTINLNSETVQIDRVLTVIERGIAEKKPNNISDIKQLQGEIQLDNVSFKYFHSDQNVINEISMTIRPQCSLAIVGESGSGKTTLVKLLVGLYKPNFGTISFNNIDLQNISDEAKCSFINIVMQDPQLFNMSIYENLLMAKPDATREEMDEACKIANIYEFIQSLPQKYETLIGENGIKLSGGQKQRLAIARTILLDPQVLIFDEATSAIDNESEELIVKSLRKLSKLKTVIIIAHRYSTISKSDDVIIIKSGKIIEQGAMDMIIQKSETFSTLFDSENRS